MKTFDEAFAAIRSNPNAAENLKIGREALNNEYWQAMIQELAILTMMRSIACQNPLIEIKSSLFSIFSAGLLTGIEMEKEESS